MILTGNALPLYTGFIVLLYSSAMSNFGHAKTFPVSLHSCYPLETVAFLNTEAHTLCSITFLPSGLHPPPQAMSSLDLISCGRVSLGQRLLERISKQRLGGAGIMSGISVGGILSVGVQPKMTLPYAGQIHNCNPSSSCLPGP